MPHFIHIAGNGNFIAWTHKNNDKVQTALESRVHASIYEGVSVEDAMYVASHVGLFWCIGTFRIRDGECVNIALSKNKAPSLFSSTVLKSKLALEKSYFIEQLCKKRNIKISYVDDMGDNAAEDKLSHLCIR